jgi:hypothetical protein
LQLEPLEDRAVPTFLAGGAQLAAEILPFPLSQPLVQGGTKPESAVLAGRLAIGGQPNAAPKPIQVTVAQNASETVIDLQPIFSAVAGLQHGDPLRFSMLGNTNSGLVTTDLSEAELALTYTKGQSGTATITVCATDADGVSARQTLVVTVTPLTPVVVRVSPGTPPATPR